jgi:hypothetical protein
VIKTMIVAGSLALARTSAFVRAKEADAIVLAKAIAQAQVPLQTGLRASEREGRPISARYEIEDGRLQLSVYTTKNSGFEEVIVDHSSGIIKKIEKMTDLDELREAQAQEEAMTEAKRPLADAVEGAISTNAGYLAVSVTPALSAGKAIAEIQLIKGTERKQVSEALN